MAPIGIAILGCGIFVQEEHLPAVEACSDVVLKAVYSRSEASAKKLLQAKSGVDIYSDDSENGLGVLLARSDIQAVIIALPITIQPEVIKKALGAGKHVLSEKPVAKDLAQARELISYKQSYPDLNWSVAENFRFQETWRHAHREITALGRVINFRSRVCWLVTPGWKYYETSWRKTPDYQGGFLLDAGVHYAASMRILLSDEKIVKVSAFTASNFEHLPPVDTISAIFKTDKGVVGSFEVSVGTTFEGWEFAVACENGSVTVRPVSEVVVLRRKPGGGFEDEIVKKFPDDKEGVGQEVAAFAKAVIAGSPDERQTPELAVGDLEIIEKMLRSGENDGAVMEINGGLTA
ncbi:hypothetical protein HOY82DRAFT_566490 [Tuber indicum]|nr:hypothetical protein HOY82DRAFT_566490 [Tuber indicum]